MRPTGVLVMCLLFTPVRAPEAGSWASRSAAAEARGVETDCREVDGLGPLLVPGTTVILGEIHGTLETPMFAGDAACAALKRGLPVTVALEIEREETARIERFLDSAGSREDRAVVVAGAFWQSEWQDGRRSEAQLALLERLRRWRRAGLSVRVALLDQAESHRPAGSSRPQLMAARLAEVVAGTPDRWIVVVVGNVHAQMAVGTPWDPSYEPMAYRARRALSERRLVSLNIANEAGTAWMCSTPTDPAGCGVKAVPRSGLALAPWRLILGGKGGQGRGSYDGVYGTGPLTPSLPAKSANSP